MSNAKIYGLMVLIICIFSFPALAGDFDGSKPLICAVMDVVECQPGGKCQPCREQGENHQHQQGQGKRERDVVLAKRRACNPPATNLGPTNNTAGRGFPKTGAAFVTHSWPSGGFLWFIAHS